MKNSKWERIKKHTKWDHIEKINPVELFSQWGFYDLDMHVEYRESFQGDYEIRRECYHDGTFSFTLELLQEVLGSIVLKKSYYKKDTIDWNKLQNIKYIVGDIIIYTKYQRVKLPAGVYPGERQIAVLLVKCEYVYQLIEREENKI